MSIFKFKQFQVSQSQSGAKITTDATVFAAAILLKNRQSRILEIGAGTGVISLMLAQRFPQSHVTAIEIEPAAAKEASENFEASPFSSRLVLLQGDVKEYDFEHQYDYIVSNPPFFKNHQKSAINPKKNKAYHTESLSLSELANSIDKNLSFTGVAFLMLPPYESALMKDIMKPLGFHCTTQITLKHTSVSPAVRHFLAFEKNKERKSLFNSAGEEICIRNQDNTFGEHYQRLLSPFLIIF